MNTINKISEQRKMRGIGKKYYPVRMVGFGIAGIVQAAYLWVFPELLSPLSVITCVQAFAWAHIAFLTYRLSGGKPKVEMASLLLDNFWVGWYLPALHFAYLPSLLFVTMTTANNISVSGSRRFVYGIVLLMAGILSAGSITGFSYQPSESLPLELLCGVFLLLYFSFYGYLIYQRTIFVKKASAAIEEKNEEIEQQREYLHQKNQQVAASINYARRIQQAALPQDSKLELLLPLHFVINRPRNIVSGDFYWAEAKGGKIFIALADCTGHGVPGAFMSLIGSLHLEQLILIQGLQCPGQILDAMHLAVQNTLKQESSDNRDGMDIGLCVIDTHKALLHYAGAKIPLLYTANGDLLQIKGDRMSIGGEQRKQQRSFTSHTLNLNPSMSYFYLSSDGYRDQFGSPQHCKMGSRRMKELLGSCGGKAPAQQKAFLEKAFDDWKASENQIDDVLLLGFGVPHLAV